MNPSNNPEGLSKKNLQEQIKFAGQCLAAGLLVVVAIVAILNWNNKPEVAEAVVVDPQVQLQTNVDESTAEVERLTSKLEKVETELDIAQDQLALDTKKLNSYAVQN